MASVTVNCDGGGGMTVPSDLVIYKPKGVARARLRQHELAAPERRSA